MCSEDKEVGGGGTQQSVKNLFYMFLGRSKFVLGVRGKVGQLTDLVELYLLF